MHRRCESSHCPHAFHSSSSSSSSSSSGANMSPASPSPSSSDGTMSPPERMPVLPAARTPGPISTAAGPATGTPDLSGTASPTGASILMLPDAAELGLELDIIPRAVRAPPLPGVDALCKRKSIASAVQHNCSSVFAPAPATSHMTPSSTYRLEGLPAANSMKLRAGAEAAMALMLPLGTKVCLERKARGGRCAKQPRAHARTRTLVA